ncbi:zf-HC2 domain-containing protein [Streptomyces sp. NPDC050842]|uniref:zf-HC2 domain-containing protein n=1 Tax=Streptomyces sp. NPDC050842 TaxID=3365636 RepID=UPI0037B9E38D
MTSTTGKADTTQHPDVSEISDLTEGLLSPSRSAAVRRHLDGCPLCADVRTSLEEIRGLLGTLPGPPRMPAEIAGRIDAALAAEALLQATAPESGSPVSRETGRSRTEPDPSGPPSPAAERPAGRPKAATGPGRPGKPRRRRIALVSTLGAAFAAAVLGTSLFLSQGGSPTADSAQGAKKADVSAVALAPFSGAPVEERVHALLGEEASVAKTPQGVGPESMSAEGATTPSPQRNRDSAVPGCVLAGTGRTDAVLAHERGEYQGTPAYLVVLADPTDSTRVQAFVLDASCADRSTSSGSPAADLLLSETYPRS